MDTVFTNQSLAFSQTVIAAQMLRQEVFVKRIQFYQVKEKKLMMIQQNQIQQVIVNHTVNAITHFDRLHKEISLTLILYTAKNTKFCFASLFL